LGGAAMKTIVMVGYIFAVFTGPLLADPASDLECKTVINSTYCKNGKLRQVCRERNLALWKDTRTAVSIYQFDWLSTKGPVATPFCICVDLHRTCLQSR